jgi:putative transposase
MILLKWLDDRLDGGSMSDVDQSLAHAKWDCKYHIVFVPKRRRKAIFGHIRLQLGPIFHALAKQKECQIVEGHLMPDHVHMCMVIPPKPPVASVIGFLKGKSAIAIARLSGKEGIPLANTCGHAVTQCPP